MPKLREIEKDRHYEEVVFVLMMILLTFGLKQRALVKIESKNIVGKILCAIRYFDDARNERHNRQFKRRLCNVRNYVNNPKSTLMIGLSNELKNELFVRNGESSLNYCLRIRDINVEKMRTDQGGKEQFEN